MNRFLRLSIAYAIAAGCVCIAALTGLSPSCAQAPKPWSRQSDGILVQTPTGQLQLQVWAPDIIRVHTGPAIHSLAVIGTPEHTAWRVQSDSGSVAVVTSRLQARVDRRTGAVRFLDPQGSVLLAERSGERNVSDIPLRRTAGADAGPGFQVAQAFDMAPDEDFYGLGQHQDGAMSYRGRSVTLLQQNREVAIPFLVSSRGYGLLWDNPSVNRVDLGGGVSQAIPPSRLEDENGKSGGLTARYYTGENFGALAAQRTDPSIDFDWSVTPPSGLPHDNYSVRWTGMLQADKGGDYTLSTTADDGIRLWVDDKPVIDDWQVHAATTDSAILRFTAGSRHKIRLEYFQAGGGAVVKLSWSPPSSSQSLRWSSEAGRGIDYYLLYGPRLDRVVAGYRSLTGQAPMPPKWALGYWQSKEHYQSQQELLDVAGRYRAEKIPIDVIVQDWQYWPENTWGSHQFDSQRYPDPAGLMRDLHAENIHMMISVWARFLPNTANIAELAKAGALYSTSAGDFHYYDPFNPTARRVYWDQISRELLSKGLDGWWLDASEPELTGNWGEYREYDTAAGPATRVFNAFPLEHTRAVYEGQREDAPEKRVMILTRSAYSGQQRYGAATWSGDITASWSVFAKQIPAGLNFCLSGIPYWTTDIGAFMAPGQDFPGGASDPKYRELFTRWFEYGAFCPIFRAHGTNIPREMWQFGPDTEKILVRYDKLRYSLMPYLYSQAWQVTHKGGTIMRPLVMDFPQDQAARRSRDQFLFGPSLLVCPVTQPGVTSREVILPQGSGWFDFWTGKPYTGGRTITAPASIDTEPIFVRGGSIIPMGSSIEYASQQTTDPIELRIYPGANADFTLYEDENDSYRYERGKYATIPIRWDDAAGALLIGARTGSFPHMQAQRAFRVVLVRPGRSSKTVSYDGRAVTVRLSKI